MKLVSVETPEKSVCKMTFSATAEELEAASNAVYERTRANYTIKGFEKGEKSKTIEFAKKLKCKGYDLETIQELTELSIEEISKL